MKSIKKLATTMAIAGIIIMSVNSAQAGILMSDLTGGGNPDPCTQKVEKVDNGIIISGLTSILGSGVVDMIFGKSDPEVNCGIIISG